MSDDLGVGGLRASGHRAKSRRGRGCVPVLIAVVVIAVLAGFAYVKGVDFIKNQLSGPADYSGSGVDPAVKIEVKDGDTATDIGTTLYDKGVVKSVGAFTDAASADERSLTIQVGTYLLKSKMSAKSALAILVDPASIVKTPSVTIPEGLRAEEILAAIAKQTSLTPKALKAAYDDTAALGLPDYAKGDPEGYLFPSTYDVKKNTTAAELLHEMVAKFVSEADALGLEQKAAAVGQSPTDIVTIASLVQAESPPDDMAKVASVVYNRLDAGMPLQFDSTLHYAVDSRGEVLAGSDLRNLDSPYNTYKLTGLTPTPIDSPGEAALKAALEPAQTDYLYFVTVNLATGETKFASTLDEHNRNVAEYRKYCETSDEC
ncbi:MAG: endolytic transglycosylase MltG [Nocardioidaceae bacterium]